eukprot:13837399-Alexandrium_andersonii.AAC.2
MARAARGCQRNARGTTHATAKAQRACRFGPRACSGTLWGTLGGEPGWSGRPGSTGAKCQRTTWPAAM